MATVLNTTYIVCKRSTPGSPVRRELKRFLRYQIARHCFHATTDYGRERLRGAIHAFSRTNQLLNARIEELSDRYSKVRDELIESLLGESVR